MAAWLLVGRLVGLARAAIALLRLGFCAEVAPIARVMHEPTRIVHAIADRQERGADELAGQVEAAIEGLHLDDDDDFVEGLSLPISDALSHIIYSRRSGMEDAGMWRVQRGRDGR